MAVVTFKLADWTAPLVEHFFGIPDVALPTVSYTSSILIAAPLNWLIDRIPGLNKVNFSIKNVQKYLGVFGDPMRRLPRRRGIFLEQGSFVV